MILEHEHFSRDHTRKFETHYKNSGGINYAQFIFMYPKVKESSSTLRRLKKLCKINSIRSLTISYVYPSRKTCYQRFIEELKFCSPEDLKRIFEVSEITNFTCICWGKGINPNVHEALISEFKKLRTNLYCFGFNQDRIRSPKNIQAPKIHYIKVKYERKNFIN